MREIIFDTETTGLDPADGHRLVEIGCVELVNYCETGRVFHTYLNPGRAMPPEAFAVHGLSDNFLADKPRFADVVEEFLAFIGEDPLVAHNAEFDLRFLNAELSAIGRDALGMHRIVDTLALARRRWPGAKHSLDALCTRYGVDRSARVRHGALLDAELLAQVYVELRGGRQIGLTLAETASIVAPAAPVADRPFRPARPHAASAAELAAHAAFVARIKDALWLRA